MKVRPKNIAMIGGVLALSFFLFGLFRPNLIAFFDSNTTTVLVHIPEGASSYSPLWGTPFMFVPNAIVVLFLEILVGAGLFASLCLCFRFLLKQRN